MQNDPTIQTEKPKPNFVERRKAREVALENGAPALWNQLRAAIQDACASYNTHYAATPGAAARAVTCKLENGKRVLVEKLIRTVHSASSFRDDKCSLIVSFESQPPVITVAGDAPVKAASFFISSGEDTAFIGSIDRPREVDDICRAILEPLFFPPANYSDVS